jgi:hypothetical protein
MAKKIETAARTGGYPRAETLSGVRLARRVRATPGGKAIPFRPFISLG